MGKGIKHGGREKGVPNKVTQQTRTLILGFLENKWPDVAQSFEKLSDRDKVYFYERMLQYAMPKYQSVGFELKNMSESDLELLIDKLKEDTNVQPR